MRIIKVCGVCGKEFVASKMTSKYCSRRCERVAFRKRESKRRKMRKKVPKLCVNILHRNFWCVKDSETFKIDYSMQNLKRGIPYTFNCGLASLP